MLARRDNHNTLIAPENPFETALLARYLAKGTPWNWSRAANGWLVPSFAVGGLHPEVVQKLPSHLIQPPRPQPANPFELGLLPERINLFGFQRPEVLNLLTGPWGLWAACGVGKTMMSLCAYHLLRRKGLVDGAIVVGPEAGRHVWCGPESDAAKWISDPGFYVSGKKDVMAAERGIIYLTAAKIFRSPYFEWITGLIRTRRWVLIVDEVHTSANVLSQRGAVLDNWTSYCRWKWMLSATPVRNYPDSFWGVYRFVTGDRIEYHQWLEWFRPGKSRQASWRRDRLDALSRYMGFCTSSISKSDAAPWLPPVTEHLIKVKMRGRQRELYAQMIAAARMAIEESGGGVKHRVAGQDIKQKLTMLQSLASHPVVAGDAAWKDRDVAKLDTLLYLVDGLGDEKVTIWSWHPAVLDWLQGIFSPERAVRYHGQVGKSEKDEAVRRFNNDARCQIFLGNPMSAGESLNLGAGTARIYWDLGWSWVQYHQAGERINRITRKLPITSWVLLSENSVEELIWDAIQKKMDLASTMTGGKGSELWSTSKVREALNLW